MRFLALNCGYIYSHEPNGHIYAKKPTGAIGRGKVRTGAAPILAKIGGF